MGKSQLQATLLVQNGDFAGLRYPLGAEETLIGRVPTMDITLVDDGISREHSMIMFDEVDGSYSIEDLQSTNGTKVNGKRVRSAQHHDGDVIQIGHTCFLFRLRRSRPTPDG